MYHTAGFSRDSITGLCSLIHESASVENRAWPPILGLFKSVVVALTYLRRNRVQAELAETYWYEVSQSTIRRAIAGVTPVAGQGS